MTLRRLILTFKDGELVVHTLYGTKSPDSPTPNTKGRARQAKDLTRDGLELALEALKGDVAVVGTSGFTQREDVLLATTSPNAQQLVKGA